MPATGDPRRYPGAQKELAIPMAPAAEPAPAKDAIAVGKATKNDPLAPPFTAAKMTRGANELLTGQIASILTALASMVIASVFKEPILSHENPEMSRPSVDDSPKPATNAAPIDGLRPIELAKSGRKNDGTKSAKVLTAPERQRHRNGKFLSIDQSIREEWPIEALSLINKDAGIPVASMSKPKIRNAHGRPTVLITP